MSRTWFTIRQGSKSRFNEFLTGFSSHQSQESLIQHSSQQSLTRPHVRPVPLIKIFTFVLAIPSKLDSVSYWRFQQQIRSWFEHFQLLSLSSQLENTCFWITFQNFQMSSLATYAIRFQNLNIFGQIGAEPKMRRWLANRIEKLVWLDVNLRLEMAPVIQYVG